MTASGEAAALFEALPDQATPTRSRGGVPRLRCAERSQVEWRPFSLDQLVPEDHRVRLVWQFVEGLDLTAEHYVTLAQRFREGLGRQKSAAGT